MYTYVGKLSKLPNGRTAACGASAKTYHDIDRPWRKRPAKPEDRNATNLNSSRSHLMSFLYKGNNRTMLLGFAVEAISLLLTMKQCKAHLTIFKQNIDPASHHTVTTLLSISQCALRFRSPHSLHLDDEVRRAR